MGFPNIIIVLGCAWLSIGDRRSQCVALSPPEGSAARPLQKKTVAVVGTGGNLGGLTFGFLQRAGSLFQTGMAKPRALGATADTSARLNTLLSKRFCLAYADESHIMLTNLDSVAALQRRLSKVDAIIMGDLSSWNIREIPVTLGTYENNPNQRCNEVYWKSQQFDNEPGCTIAGEQIQKNILEAAAAADVKHIVVLETTTDSITVDLMQQSSIPTTRIQVMNSATLAERHDYSYRRGVESNLAILMQEFGSMSVEQTSETVLESNAMLFIEDIAALAVQILLSLDWNESRDLLVIPSTTNSNTNIVQSRPKKRPDQEWCVNSCILEEALIRAM